MIISKTPFRISFLGGGTDFPQWFKEHDGAVISATIDKYAYISLRPLPPFFSHKHRVVYTDIELVEDLSQIKHPSVRECLRFLRISDGLEIHYDGDLPSRSGLGSSSSFTVGLLNALKAYQGQMISHEQLADLAILIEREIIGESGGLQDQLAVAHGGLNYMHFSDSYKLFPIIMSPKNKLEFENSLCLFFTGKSRIAEEIEKSKIKAINEKTKYYEALFDLVKEGLDSLTSQNFSARSFGSLLSEAWQLKKSLAREVTNMQIEEIYERGLSAGAHGGKILGAGGGGFFLFCVDSYKKDSFVEAMKPLLHVPFHFENQGTQIMLYQP